MAGSRTGRGPWRLLHTVAVRLAVFLVSLFVRIAAIELAGAEEITFGDGLDYVATARSICTERVYPEQGNLPFFRAPGLPFFVAGVTACEPSRTRAIKYGLAVCDALTVLLIFLIAQRLYASPVAPLLAAAIAALHPFFAGAVTDVRSEPLFMMLLVAATWLLLRENHALSGSVLALAALTRPTALLCIPLFAFFAAIGKRRPIPEGTRARFYPAVVLLVSAMLTLGPWTLRNYIRFGELIPVNDAAGFNLWRGTNPEVMRIVETWDRAQFAERSLRFESQTVAEAARDVSSRAHSPGARDREWRRMALENVRRDPAFAIRSTAKKLAMYWRPWLHPAEHGPKAIALSLIVNLGLFTLGAIGLMRYPERRTALAVLFFFVALWLAHLPYIPTMRLRVPLTDPLLIVFAAGALAQWLPVKESNLAANH